MRAIAFAVSLFATNAYAAVMPLYDSLNQLEVVQRALINSLEVPKLRSIVMIEARGNFVYTILTQSCEVEVKLKVVPAPEGVMGPNSYEAELVKVIECDENP